MIFGGTEREQHRVKYGVLFLVVGVVLMLWAWGSWIYRTSKTSEGASLAGDLGAQTLGETEKAVRLAPSVLLGVALVILVFFVASYVFVRASRRYRMSLERRTAAPTDSRDVWSTHKLKSLDDSDA